MKIGIDAGCLSVSDDRLKVGVYRMTLAYLTYLTRIDRKNTYFLYSFAPIDKDLLSNFGSKVKNIVVKPQLGWFKIWLPRELRKNPVDVFLGFSQSLPELPLETKGLVFVHDLTFEKNSQWFEKSFKKMSANSKSAVLKAEKIIAVSKATRNDLIKLYEVPKNKIEVIYEGLDNRLTKIKKTSGKQTLPYFLFVGTYKQSKNIPNILRAFSLFHKQYPRFKLMICGSDYWLDKEIDAVLSDLNLGNAVKNLGFVSDQALRVLYAKATAFVSPSFNEGFGLTFLEAASFKIPIITSRIGSLMEILGRGALYVDPKSPEEISKALKKIVSNNKLCSKITQLAFKNIQKFSWEKAAKQLLRLIQKYEK